MLPFSSAFSPFITPKPAFNLCKKTIFCILDEETMQRTMGEKMRGGGWTVGRLKWKDLAIGPFSSSLFFVLI